MNRDYFTRPIQGNGRHTQDYGNTRLRTNRSLRQTVMIAIRGNGVAWWEAAVVAAAVCGPVALIMLGVI